MIAQEFNGDPTERKISELDFLSVGIPFVSRWLTIATSAYRRQPFCDPNHLLILYELAESLESSRSMVAGYGSIEHRAEGKIANFEFKSD